jgi:predicted DNA-binding antitoxin AbrB/MazE fold protein
MDTIIEATFDGSVFHPADAVPLKPNTMVRLTIQSLPSSGKTGSSFLKTARQLELQGPPDWASNLDHYLYGKESDVGQ